VEQAAVGRANARPGRWIGRCAAANLRDLPHHRRGGPLREARSLRRAGGRPRFQRLRGTAAIPAGIRGLGTTAASPYRSRV